MHRELQEIEILNVLIIGKKSICVELQCAMQFSFDDLQYTLYMGFMLFIDCCLGSKHTF